MSFKYLIIFSCFFLICNLQSIENNAIKKMRNLSHQLRCMVCQNQSLLESDSELAKDLKFLIQEKFKQGMSEREIKKFLVERYGEFILFKPPLKTSNLILWVSPFLSIFLVAFVALRKIKIINKKK